MLKVIHVQNNAKSAGAAAVRLHNAFLESGIDSYIISLHPGVNDTDRFIYAGRFAKFKSRLEFRLNDYKARKNDKRFGLFSYSILGTDISKNKKLREADVIYLHWYQGGFLNIKNIRQLAKLGKPIIFFLHDMWSITGGCHYSFECEKYVDFCEKCPVLSGKNARDWSSKEFKEKSKLMSDFNNLFFVSPSKWLADCATKSAITRNKPVFCIPNLLDNNVFKPIEKNIIKSYLNIDLNKPVIAFGAVSVDSPYKGWKYLKQSLILLKEYISEATILVFGGGNLKEISNEIPFEIKSFGYLSDEYSTALVYNAADVFIAPSIAEAFGYVVMESLCCGTPVVSFETGGIKDMIKHKENGYLAKYKDTEDLANGVQYCLSNKINGFLSDEFSRSLTVSKHTELMLSILNKSV